MAEPGTPPDNNNPTGSQIPTPPIKSGIPDLKFSGNQPSLPPNLPTSAGPLPPLANRPSSPSQNITDAPREYKSTIRTMADDIAKIKVGQQPSGTNLQKAVTFPTPPVFQPKTAPISPQPPISSLPPPYFQPERPRPIITPPIAPRPQIQPSPAPESVLPVSSGKPKMVMYLLIILGVLLIGVVYLFLRSGNQEVTVSPTPEETATTTPTPVINLETTFGSASESIPLAGGIPEFLSEINNKTIVAGELKNIRAYLTGPSPSETDGDLNFIRILDINAITYPTQIKNTLGTDHAFLIYGQREVYDSKGKIIINAPPQKRLIFIIEVADPITFGQILTGWEANITDALAKLFELNKTKAASPDFLTNIYQSSTVKYRNFPYADRSIDYTLITGKNNKSYFIISNSREAIYTALDKFR